MDRLKQKRRTYPRKEANLRYLATSTQPLARLPRHHGTLQPLARQHAPLFQTKESNSDNPLASFTRIHASPPGLAFRVSEP